MLRRLYDWTMSLASGRHSERALAGVSFVESSFFPIPPDILLIPMIIAQPQKAWRLATIATISSVVGGFLGYAIGYFLFEAVGQPILQFYGIVDKYDELKHLFDTWGAWIIIVKGMTPIPYKFLTITAGALHFDLLVFTIASVISRGLRFFLVAALLWKFGEPIRDFIEKRLTLVLTLGLVILIGGFVVIKYLI
ncbi:MAG TPA: YqaA family protein [Alphaproteobacteria bacterium]|nr:YqaA family protein [Alphaproteobacteria bacterium]